MDLNSINANINRLLTNIWAVISFLKEFAVDGAKDVSITYINADGSESVKTFPNIAKMVASYNITYTGGYIKDLSGNIIKVNQNIGKNNPIVNTATIVRIDSLSSEWETVCELNATQVGFRFEITTGHNSAIYSDVINSSTYTYNVDDGTEYILRDGSTNPGDFSFRRYVTGGRNYFQIKRNSNYGTVANIRIFSLDNYTSTF